MYLPGLCASNLACNAIAWFLVWVNNGEPSSVHTVAYAAAERLGRICRIIRFKIHHQINLGTSTTRGSDKNCFKYGLRACLVGASGVPKLLTNMPILSVCEWVNTELDVYFIN